jgi:predicted RNase H-like HicB family nuclease
MKNFTAIFEAAEEGGFVCWIEEIPEAMSQGNTFEEAKINLMDALKLVIEVNREQAESKIRHSSVIREFIPISAI